MRRVPRPFACLVIAGCALAAGTALADEHILSFDSAITVEHDGTLEVHETIRVLAEGHAIRRGIFRDFPTIYPAVGGRTVTVGFWFESASRDGQPEPWRVEPASNGLRIYLGSASVMLAPGEHTYDIVYRTDRQMGYFADHDELYWNVTGNGTAFVTDRASAHVQLPSGVPADKIELEAYTGPQGARGKAYTAALANGVPTFSTTGALGPHEGLTIVVSWPKGFVTVAPETPRPAGATSSPGYNLARDAGVASSSRFDSPAENILKRELPHDGRPLWFALGGLALLLLYYWRMWNRVGRDPPGRVIIPEYEIPRGHSPAAMRYLTRMGYDDKCFAAAVLSLAVKGYLRIDQDSKLLGLGKTYTLVRAQPKAAPPLSADESGLLGRLFQGADTVELLQKNHSTIRGTRRMHEASLDEHYETGYFRINGGWHFLGILISIAVIAASVLQPGAIEPWPRWFLTTPHGWITLAAALCCFIANGVFGWLLKAPTVAGQEALDHIRGFRMYLEVAEGEELKRASGPKPALTPQLYESFLPAALALGVEQAWAERFARVLDVEAPNYHPAWYSGGAFHAANIASFTSQLGSSLSSAISSSAQAPGSSSGSHGGGSSGGGGGGGGTGGW